jgi:hypothetical protein
LRDEFHHRHSLLRTFILPWFILRRRGIVVRMVRRNFLGPLDRRFSFTFGCVEAHSFTDEKLRQKRMARCSAVPLSSLKGLGWRGSRSDATSLREGPAIELAQMVG